MRIAVRQAHGPVFDPEAQTRRELSRRADWRGWTQADFVAKISIVEEEADEAVYWIELAVDSGLLRRERVADLLGEADQLVAIAVSSVRTARKKG